MLDPQVQKLLEWASKARTAPYPQLGVPMARAAYERASAVLEVPELPMHDVHDHRVTLPGRTITIRQYTPREHSWAHPTPALLFFHGGGFTIGSLSTHDRLCRVLASGADCQVFAVDYRLAPEHRFPAASDDAFDGLDWLLSQAPMLGFDPSRLAVGGDSAGGTLATTTALRARDRGIPLVLQLLIYPGLAAWQDSPSHRRLAAGYLLDADTIQWFFAQYLPDPSYREDWRFAPLKARDLSRVAPAWLALAEYDPLVDEGLIYADRLRDAGVPVSCTVWPGMVHAFFQHGGFVPLARQAHAAACTALRDAFGAH